MKNKSFLLLVTVLLTLHLRLLGQQDFTYITNQDSTITISGYTGSDLSLTIPGLIDGKVVSGISEYAFYGGNLTNVTIPNSVTSIGEAVFGENPLTGINVQSGGKSFLSVDGVLFNFDQSSLIAYPSAKPAASYTIPNSVTTISGNAFDTCLNLTEITIPNSVTSIGEAAFINCSGLTTVTIPNSVTNIGGYAFQQTGLITITIPDSVSSIPVQAFEDCSSLTSVTIPNSVTNIGPWAFDQCQGLTNITIPNSVTSIGQNAFSRSGLLEIDVQPGGNSFSSVDGVLFSFDGSTLIAYPTARPATFYSIPTGVISIADGSFYCCDNLTSVAFPNTVANIGFSGLEEDGYVVISAFFSCTGLTNISIPSSVTNIGGFAFLLCKNLASVELTNGITSIGPSAFSECTRLSSIVIPDGVISIGKAAFLDCPISGSLMIPGSVTNIGAGAFGGSALTGFNLQSGNRSYSTVEGVLFNRDQSTLIAYPTARPVTSYSIPGNVTFINDFAFRSCTNITGVEIPSSVNSIGNDAFYGCSRLFNLTVPYSVSRIGYYAFIGCDSLSRVNFEGSLPFLDQEAFDQSSAVLYYLPGASGWDSSNTYTTMIWERPDPVILAGSAGIAGQPVGFEFTVSWATNASVVIEAATNLFNPVWQPLQTNSLTAGVLRFIAPDTGLQPAHFYRAKGQ